LESREKALLPGPLARSFFEARRDDDRAALPDHRRRGKAQVGGRTRGLTQVHVLGMAYPGDHDVVLLRDGTFVERRGLRGEPRVLVRLDDPGRDDELGLLDELLREAWHAVGLDRAEVGPFRGIATVRVDDTDAVDGAAELLALLGFGRRPVQADRDDDRDALVGNATTIELIEQGRHEDRVG